MFSCDFCEILQRVLAASVSFPTRACQVILRLLLELTRHSNVVVETGFWLLLDRVRTSAHCFGGVLEFSQIARASVRGLYSTNQAHVQKRKLLLRILIVNWRCYFVIQLSKMNQKQKKNRRKKSESVGRKKQFRFGCLLQPWTVEVLVLNWSAQSQDLHWRDTSSNNDQRDGRTTKNRNFVTFQRSSIYCKEVPITGMLFYSYYYL